MKAKQNRMLQVSIFVIGLVCLMAGSLQLTINLVQMQYDLPSFLMSDAMYAILLLVPEIFIFLYIALRLYGELKSVWRMILAVIGYPVVGLVWSLIVAISSESSIGAILGYGSIFAAIAVPIILSIVGMVKKTAGMTLISFMIFNLCYTMYTLFLYGLSYWEIDNAVQVSIYFILPLMLLLSADLAVQYRLAANRGTQIETV